MIQSQLIRHANVVNEDRIFPADVWIRDGRIAGVFETPPPPPIVEEAEVTDADGKYLLPGVIDDQVHFREPGLTHKADIATESAAAVAGGVTTFMDMPNTIPQTVTVDALMAKYRLAARESHANYAFYLGATNDNLDELRKVDTTPACGVKLFMGSSTGGMLVEDETILSRIFAEVPALIAVHAEDEQRIRQRMQLFREQYGEQVPIACHPQIRDAEACFRSSERAVRIAGKYQARLHLLHLSTAREMSLLQGGVPLREKRITAEVCVHHLWFQDTDYATLGARIKCNPAIKTMHDRLALAEALRQHKIDVIGSDHAPHTLEEKSGPSYFSVPSGMPLVQHMLPMMLEKSREGAWPLTLVVRKMCHAPADLFRIKDRGYIRPGCWADLVLADLDSPYRVERSDLLYKCGWSPLEGVEFHTRICKTWVNGHVAYDGRNVTPERWGRPVEYNRIT